MAASPRRPRRRHVGALVAASAAVAGLRWACVGFSQAGHSQGQPPVERQTGGSRRGLLAAALGALAPAALLQDDSSSTAWARMAYPPIDKYAKNRCQWQSSAMGQANAQRDKLFDLRQCKMMGSSAAEKDIAGVLMNEGDFSNVNFQQTIMSKAIIENATMVGANFKDAVADRVTFLGTNLKDANFNNCVLTGASFEGANLENTDFTDAYIDQYGVRPLCRNPTLKGKNPKTGADTYESVGCDNQGLAR
uniref:Uncharacterized protein n=1 Tax=Zooxanthella nutricula TaxID=1333877 RepID=A0A6U6QVR9_9DINO|mmetsp:Transcript_68647/g.210471  ORF Transcript_68647/g.210471 Transcript_68647/m.210471 type:complete len:249 (+) Transcript_68647:56-802(+)